MMGNSIGKRLAALETGSLTGLVPLLVFGGSDDARVAKAEAEGRPIYRVIFRGLNG